MDGMMDKIKGKLLAGWDSLFSSAPTPPVPTEAFSAQTLYYIFHPRGPVESGAISKSGILDGTRKVERLLVQNRPDGSPEHTLFLMAFREFQGVIHNSENENGFSFEDKLLIPLYDHWGVLSKTIDMMVARQQEIKGDGGISALLGTTEIKALQKEIRMLTHVNNRFGTLFMSGHIAEQAQRQRRDMQAEYAAHSPFIPREWRIG